MKRQTCHICLDEFNRFHLNKEKKCCSAFICKECWIELNNNDIRCAICRTEFIDPEDPEDPDDSDDEIDPEIDNSWIITVNVSRIIDLMIRFICWGSFLYLIGMIFMHKIFKKNNIDIFSIEATIYSVLFGILYILSFCVICICYMKIFTIFN